MCRTNEVSHTVSRAIQRPQTLLSREWVTFKNISNTSRETVRGRPI